VNSRLIKYTYGRTVIAILYEAFVMTQVEAIYQGGVFKPLESVRLAENERVRLNIQPITLNQTAEWLQKVQKLQNEIIAIGGFFPDSTSDIAADRAR